MSDTPAEALAAVVDRWGDPPAEMIGYLPKVSCQACTRSNTKVCERHEKKRCDKCKGYLTTAHVDIEFVGHADITRILLSIDPCWNWEPASTDANGAPTITRDGPDLVMWGRLTLLGVTRLGVGTVKADSFDAQKQLIGDFLRNAAMRFGIAIGLWSKSDRAADAITASGEAPSPPATPPAPAEEPANQDQIDEIGFISKSVLDAVQRQAMRTWADDNGLDMKHLTYRQAEAVIDKMRALGLEPKPANDQPTNEPEQEPTP